MIKAEFKSRLAEARQKIPKVKVDWHPTDDPQAAYNASKVALMIEPRPIPHLVPQILHMINTVPPDWRFVFIGTEKSVVSVGRAFATKHQQVIGKMDLMVLPEPWEIESKESVFRLLTDLRFYDEFLPGVEWILKYEHDSILCSNSGKSLNDWLDWSWAGAPRYAFTGCFKTVRVLLTLFSDLSMIASLAMEVFLCDVYLPSGGSSRFNNATMTQIMKTNGSASVFGYSPALRWPRGQKEFSQLRMSTSRSPWVIISVMAARACMTMSGRTLTSERRSLITVRN